MARLTPAVMSVSRRSTGAEERDAMEDLRYDRLYRTPSSEAYLVSANGETVGRVELHYTSSITYGLLVLENPLEGDALTDLLERLDEELVSSADVPRDDFVISVYQGQEIGVFSDSDGGDEDSVLEP